MSTKEMKRRVVEGEKKVKSIKEKIQQLEYFVDRLSEVPEKYYFDLVHIDSQLDEVLEQFK